MVDLPARFLIFDFDQPVEKDGVVIGLRSSIDFYAVTAGEKYIGLRVGEKRIEMDPVFTQFPGTGDRHIGKGRHQQHDSGFEDMLLFPFCNDAFPGNRKIDPGTGNDPPGRREVFRPPFLTDSDLVNLEDPQGECVVIKIHNLNFGQVYHNQRYNKRKIRPCFFYKIII